MPTPIAPSSTAAATPKFNLPTLREKPAASLGAIPKSSASEATLLKAVKTAWPNLAPDSGRGQQVSSAELAWLCAVANHPKADVAVWKDLAQRLKEVPDNKLTSKSKPAVKDLIAQLEIRIREASNFEPTEPGTQPGGVGGTTPPTNLPPTAIKPFSLDGYTAEAKIPVVTSVNMGLFAEATQQPPASMLKFTSDYDKTVDLAKTDTPTINLPTMAESLGKFKNSSDIHLGKAFLGFGDLLTAIATKAGIPADKITKLTAAVPAQVAVISPTHKYVVKDDSGNFVLGNRAIFHDPAQGNKDPDIVGLAHAAAAEGAYLMTCKTEWFAAQGGDLKSILSHGNSGDGHQGTVVAGYRDGEPVFVDVNWPTGYSTSLGHGPDYTPAIQAVCPWLATERTPSDADKKAWFTNYRNSILFNCCTIDFSSSDPNSAYRNYSFNPLDVSNKDDAEKLFKAQHSLSKEEIIKQGFGTFYCAEGSNTSVNMAPLGKTLMKKSQVPQDSERYKMIERYIAAEKKVAQELGPQKDVKQYPNKVWDQVFTSMTPEEQTKYTTFFNNLRQVKLDNIPLEWVPESANGIETYGVKSESGLLLEPDTVGDLVENVIGDYFGFDGTAKALAAALQTGFAKGDDEVKALIKGIIQDPVQTGELTPAALEGFSKVGAANYLAAIFDDAEFKKRILHQSGFDDDLMTPADAKKVNEIYADFVSAIRSFGEVSLDEARKAVDEANERFKDLQVTRKIPNTDRTAIGPMLYLDPSHGRQAAQGSGSGAPAVVYVGTVRPVALKKAN